MDADGDGRLSWGDMKLLYDAVQRSCSGGILLHFEDLMNQIRDMVARQRHPAKGFSAQEMWDSKLGAGVIGLLTNANNMLLQRSTAEWGRGERRRALVPSKETAHTTHALVAALVAPQQHSTRCMPWLFVVVVGCRRLPPVRTHLLRQLAHYAAEERNPLLLLSRAAACSRLPADPLRCCGRQPRAQPWATCFLQSLGQTPLGL